MANLKIGMLSLNTSIERDNFSLLRYRYVQLGEKCQSRLTDNYAKFNNADDLFEFLPELINKIYMEVTEMVAHDLAERRIYDISEKAIRSELESRAENGAINFSRVQDAYFKILGMSKELDAQREYAKNNRPHIVGGGFGVEGAAKGIAQATVANAAIGLVYGLANLTAKAASSLGDQQKKRELLNDPATKAELGDFLKQIALLGCDLVADTVNQGSERAEFETVTADSRDKSAAILENVLAGRVPDENVKSVLLQALTLNPFNDMVWIFWLKHFGDHDGSLAASADLVRIVAVKFEKVNLFAERKRELSWNTPEECLGNLNTLEKYANWLGVPFDDERILIEKRAEELDLQRRTFNGVIYPTADQAAVARKAYHDQLERTVDGVIYDTHTGANEARENVRLKIISASRSNNFFGWFLLAYRRFRDVDGRSSRQEFFMFLIFVLIVFFILIVVAANVIFLQDFIHILIKIFMSISFIVAVPLQIRVSIW